jgi:glycine/sarcosine N-methyltransferase
MPDPVPGFYDSLASHYHLIFDDWTQTIARQARILDPLLAAHNPHPRLKILDCACGIGTQALGLAALGHQLVASDLSSAAVERARSEAEARNLNVTFHVSNMTSLAQVPETGFDAVIACDNALPHLSTEELLRAVVVMRLKLNPTGIFLASIRDYDALTGQHPATQPPLFFGEPGQRRIVHQVWDWSDDGKQYILHLYITAESPTTGPWTTHHFVSSYRPLLRSELSIALNAAGFRSVQWLMPAQTGYYQPIVLAKL